MKKYKSIIILLVAVVVIGGASIAYSLLKDVITPGNNSNNASGDAPDFTVELYDGTQVNLSDYFGKPIVLNFWASWCPPCRQEMPTFEAIYADYGDTVQFMMVDLANGQGETVEVGQAFVDEQGFTFPIFFDTTGQAANKYNISSIPTTIFIDSEGKIVDKHIGIIDAIALQKGIEDIS